MMGPCEHGTAGGEQFCVTCLRSIGDNAELRFMTMRAPLVALSEEVADALRDRRTAGMGCGSTSRLAGVTTSALQYLERVCADALRGGNSP